MTIESLQKENCTGCGACFNKCRLNAIEMSRDENGFLKPIIKADKCIDCGICISVCPLEAPPSYNNPSEPVCYALWAEDNIRKVSSSGGAFTVFAEKILEDNGVVFGAILNSDLISVKHISVDSEEMLPLLRGSKYIQSDTGDTFRQTKEYLEQGKKVLYTGCPCQIAGLNAYLGKKYDNLFTIDLICHGMVSPKVWKKYLQEKEESYGRIAEVSFRTKDLSEHGGWSRSVTIKLKTEDGEVIYEERNKSDFLDIYLRSISVKQSCGKCIFAKLPRQGDLTIGDFWGIEDYDENLNDDLGTSVVLENTEKGKSLIESAGDKIKLLQEVPIEIAIKGNKTISSSPWVNPRSERFYQILDKYNLQKAAYHAKDYALHKKFDIGFVGWWYGANYGSVLTNYALHTVLTQDLDKTVLMIQYPNNDSSTEKSKSSRFASKHYDMTIPRKIEDYPALNWNCEKFVLGSDQLWNWYSIKDTGYHFLLDWVDDKKIKIAYATSFGHSKSFFPIENLLEVAELFQQFNSISVREEDGIDILRDEYGTYAEHTLDPVFLCDKIHYDEVAAEVDAMSEEPYVYAYILNPTEKKKELIYNIAKNLNKKVIILIDGQAENKEEMAQILGEKDVLLEVEIEQWLRLIKDAAFVITDSFHGMCFSIINHKKFIVIKNSKRGNTRFESVAEMLGVQDRLLETPEEMYSSENVQLLRKEIDYEKIDNVLALEKEKSKRWLMDALKKPRRKLSYNQMLYSMAKDIDDKINIYQNME